MCIRRCNRSTLTACDDRALSACCTPDVHIVKRPQVCAGAEGAIPVCQRTPQASSGVLRAPSIPMCTWMCRHRPGDVDTSCVAGLQNGGALRHLGRDAIDEHLDALLRSLRCSCGECSGLHTCAGCATGQLRGRAAALGSMQQALHGAASTPHAPRRKCCSALMRKACLPHHPLDGLATRSRAREPEALQGASVKA